VNKTVADAVKHYGTWPERSYDKNWIVYRKVGTFDMWSLWGDEPLNLTWQRVCNREQFELYVNRKPYEFDDHVSDAVKNMSAGVREFYKDGQRSNEGAANPYDRKHQVRAFHGWSAGYCDKWGVLPK